MKIDQNSQFTESDVGAWIDAARDLLGDSPSTTPERPEPGGLAGRIEHTRLKAGTSEEQLRTLVDEAIEHHFGAVCILPRDVAFCRHQMEHHRGATRVATVINFPLAGSPPPVARAEAQAAQAAGADDLDMVVDLSALIKGDLRVVRDGIALVAEAAPHCAIKVILETGLLTPEQIVRGCVAAEFAGATYVKTSTGFGPRGASTDDIALMRRAVGSRLGIKASGGIRDRAAAESLVAAGADLIGTSSGLAIIAASGGAS